MYFHVRRFSRVSSIPLPEIRSADFQKRSKNNCFCIVIGPHSINGQINAISKRQRKFGYEGYAHVPFKPILLIKFVGNRWTFEILSEFRILSKDTGTR